MAKSINYDIKVGVIGDAKLQKFQRTVDKMNKSAAKSQVALSKMSKSMAGFSAAARTAGLAIASMFTVSAVKSSLDFADAIGKSSKALGVSVESLQAYRYAAELAGVSNDKFDTSLAKLSRSIGETVTKGVGAAADAFEVLGISVQNADGSIKSTEAVFEEFADKMQGMTDPAIKVSLAMDLFGRAGAKLIPMLNEGSDGLKAMKEEAEELGIILSEETTSAAEDVNDNFARLNNQFKAATIPYMVKLSEILLDAVDALKRFGTWITATEEKMAALIIVLGGLAIALVAAFPITALIGLIAGLVIAIAANWDKIVNKTTLLAEKVKKGFYELYKGAVDALKPLAVKVAEIFDSLWNDAIAPVLSLIVGKLADVTLSLGGVSGFQWVTELGNDLEAVNQKLGETSNTAGDVGLAFINMGRDAQVSIDASVAAIAKLNEEYVLLNTEAEDAKNEVDSLNNSLTDLTLPAGGAGKSANELAKQLEKFLATIKKTKDPLETAEQNIKNLRDTFNTLKLSGLITDNDIGVIDAYNKKLGEMQEEFNGIQNEANGVNQAMDTIESGMGTAFGEIIDGSKSAKDAFSDMAISILNSIAQMALEILVIKPLMDSLKSSFGGIGGSGFSFFGLPPEPTGVATATVSPQAYGVGRTPTASMSASIMKSATLSRSSSGSGINTIASPVNVNITNNSKNEVEVAETIGNDGSRTLEVLIEGKVKDAFSSGRMDKSMKMNYGVRRVGS